MSPPATHRPNIWSPLQLTWQDSLVPWVIGSIVVGIAGAWLVWLATRRRWQWSSALRSFLASQTGETFSWLFRLAWLILPAYATLLMGLLSPRLMGLTQVSWGIDFASGVAFALFGGGILLIAGLSYRRSHTTPRQISSTSDSTVRAIRLILEAGALQWHWAFYRAALIGSAPAGTVDNLIAWGTWTAAALVVTEGILSPLFWRDLRTPGLAERRVLRAVLLVATSVLYLITANFWLAWALHASVVLMLEPRFVSLVQPGINDHEGV
ncbi:MAG: hypothetical protein U9R25_19605 [Chloroflexota bacterium]|nr:hypothetical protein [Chloroflexota bacterium]